MHPESWETRRLQPQALGLQGQPPSIIAPVQPLMTAAMRRFQAAGQTLLLRRSCARLLLSLA